VYYTMMIETSLPIGAAVYVDDEALLGLGCTHVAIGRIEGADIEIDLDVPDYDCEVRVRGYLRELCGSHPSIAS
jgi:hypothetical protein